GKGSGRERRRDPHGRLQQPGFSNDGARWRGQGAAHLSKRSGQATRSTSQRGRCGEGSGREAPWVQAPWATDDAARQDSSRSARGALSGAADLEQASGHVSGDLTHVTKATRKPGGRLPCVLLTLAFEAAAAEPLQRAANVDDNRLLNAAKEPQN